MCRRISSKLLSFKRHAESNTNWLWKIRDFRLITTVPMIEWRSLQLLQVSEKTCRSFRLCLQFAVVTIGNCLVNCFYFCIRKTVQGHLSGSLVKRPDVDSNRLASYPNKSICRRDSAGYYQATELSALAAYYTWAYRRWFDQYQSTFSGTPRVILSL